MALRSAKSSAKAGSGPRPLQQPNERAAPLTFAIGTPAQAKEGTVIATFAGFGSVKASKIGKDRLLTVSDLHALYESRPMTCG